MQNLGAQRVLVELQCRVRVADGQVWSQSMESSGNSIHLFRHESLLRRNILDQENVKEMSKNPSDAFFQDQHPFLDPRVPGFPFEQLQRLVHGLVPQAEKSGVRGD